MQDFPDSMLQYTDYLNALRQLYRVASLMPYSFATSATEREYGGNNYFNMASFLSNEQRDIFYSATAPNWLNFNSDNYEYDMIFMDCPPSIGVQQHTALCGANHVLIISQTQKSSVKPVDELIAPRSHAPRGNAYLT